MEKVHYNRPIAIGATILDLSKMYMQNFYYNILKPYYGDNMKFLYTDTDSLVVWLRTNSLKEDIKNMQECFESDSTKGLPGVMKIEKDNIQEFHALCPKQYYYIPYDPNKKTYSLVNKFKGIPEYARDIPLKSQEEIIEHLKKGKPLVPKTTYNLTSIKSKNHQIIIVDHQKEVSGMDDKRYYIDDIHTLALGHYKLNP
jgi:DNA polymerase elongation subunit (family B)